MSLQGHCTSCGNAVELDARFCGECGAPVSKSSPARTRRGLIAIAAAVVVVAVAAGLGWGLGFFSADQAPMLIASTTGDESPESSGTPEQTTSPSPTSASTSTSSTVVLDEPAYDVMLTEDSVVTSAGVMRLNDPMAHVSAVVADLTGMNLEKQGSELCGWTLYVANGESYGFLIWVSPSDTLGAFLPAPSPQVGTDRGLEGGDPVEAMFRLYPAAEHVRDIQGLQRYTLEPGTNLYANVGGDEVANIALGYDVGECLQ